MSDERSPSQVPQSPDATKAAESSAGNPSSPPRAERTITSDPVHLPPIPGLISSRYAGRVPIGSATLRSSMPPSEAQSLKRPHLPQRRPMPSPLLDSDESESIPINEEDAANQSKIFTGAPIRPSQRPRRLVPPPKPSSHPPSAAPPADTPASPPRRRMTPAPYNPATITAMRIISIGVEDNPPPSEYEPPAVPMAPPVARVEEPSLPAVEQAPLPAFDLSPGPAEAVFSAPSTSDAGPLPSAVERQLAPLPAFELSTPEAAPLPDAGLTPLPAFEMTETDASHSTAVADAVTVPLPEASSPAAMEPLPAFELPQTERSPAVEPVPLEPSPTVVAGAVSVPLLERSPSRPPEPEEITDEEVAPESVKRPPPKPPARTPASINAAKPKSDPPPAPVRSSVPALAVAEQPMPGADAADIAGTATKRNPPPPPRRSLPVPLEGAIDSSSAKASTEAAGAATAAEAPADKEEKKDAAARARRPWWEELFNEDFSRALSRLSDEQIKREATFIEDSLGVAEGGVLLDLGCGPGYHAVELAERGYAVVGYDLSLHQLALAADVAQDRQQKLNLMQGDMREMAFDSVFDGIYCWNTTFGYFEEEKNFAVAENIFKALKPGGTFLVDVINRDFVTMQQPSSVWFEGDSAVCMDDMMVDFITSRLRVKRSVMLDDGRTKECPYSIRLYSLHELGKLLHDVGFRVAEASGHPSTPGVFMGQNAPRIIILAQRP